MRWQGQTAQIPQAVGRPAWLSLPCCRVGSMELGSSGWSQELLLEAERDVRPVLSGWGMEGDVPACPSSPLPVWGYPRPP